MKRCGQEFVFCPFASASATPSLSGVRENNALLFRFSCYFILQSLAQKSLRPLTTVPIFLLTMRPWLSFATTRR